MIPRHSSHGWWGGQDKPAQALGFSLKAFFSKPLGPLTPKDAEKRLDETLFLGKLRHSAAILPHPHLGAPGLPLLAGFPFSTVCVPLSSSSLAPLQHQTGLDPSTSQNSQFGVLGDWGSLSIPWESCLAQQDGLCWDSHWDSASPGMALLPQGRCQCLHQTPKSGAGLGPALGVVCCCFSPCCQHFLSQ